MSKKNIKINFENVNFSLAELTLDEFRLKKISEQIFSMLDEKIRKEHLQNTISEEIILENLSIPAISISKNMTDNDIAKKIATEIAYNLKKSLS